MPELMISDNEGSFTRSGKEIQRLFKHQDKVKIASEMASLEIEFKFNYEYTPHYNSLYERIHAIIKKELPTKMLREPVHIAAFHLMLCQADMISNNRPLSDMRTSQLMTLVL